MHLWDVFVAFMLGLVEGLTEFAPVSSTGHMIIVDDLFFKSKELFSEQVANTFKVVIQLGSILAVVVVFKNRILNLLGLNKRKDVYVQHSSHLKLSQVFVGLLPAGVLGVLFEDYIDEHLFTTQTVIIGLVLGAILMILADIARPRVRAHTVDEITYTQAFFVGLTQCLGLWPGFSRSGSTISGGVLLGMSHRAAADFTFIMAVPIMCGASFLSLLKHWQDFTVDTLPFMVVGFVSAFVFAMISIRFFLALIQKVKLIPFAIYRILLAAALYFIFIQ